MKSSIQSHYVLALTVGAVLTGYLAGYARLRARCEGWGGPLHVVPRETPALLLTVYRPLFLAEQRLTDHRFTLTPWGMAGFEPYW